MGGDSATRAVEGTHRRRWAWWVVRFAACLLVGCVISLSLAWTGAARTQTPPLQRWTPGNWVDADTSLCWGFSERSTIWGSTDWNVARLGAAAPLRLSSWKDVPPPSGFPAKLVRALNEAMPGTTPWGGEVRATGFPYRCLWGSVLHGYAPTTAGSTGSGRYVTVHVVELPLFAKWMATRGIEGHLPIGIMWSGLLRNTAVWAAACWLFVAIPHGLRHIHRRRSGRCTRCGYDMRQTAAGAPCPECGRAA